jgi:hypothetical protein
MGLVIVAITVGGIAWEAWALMLLVGIAHNNWWPAIPPMGYGTAVVLVFFGNVFAIPSIIVKLLSGQK